jgi:hypothetical protein
VTRRKKPLDPRLDRVPRFDERSRAFPVRAAVPVSKPRSWTWRCDAYLDQGQEGACVGFSRAHEIAARPRVSAATEPLAHRIYRRAQQLDEWAGEAYSGSSVLGGVKAAQELGYVTEFRWAFGVDDLALGVSYRGPAVLGVNWYEGMYAPGPDGFLRVTGRQTGGHAILCRGYSLRRDAFLLHNSWGRSWGWQGCAWLSRADMDRLLREDGEACFSTGPAGVPLREAA